MTSIDELFKSTGSKRKLEPLRDPNQVYKSARLSSNSRRRAEVEDDSVEALLAPPPEDDEDGDYGPSMPPEDDGDDEEGRFFGGGVTSEQNEILDYVDGQDGPVEEKIDVAWLRKTALAFEKRISKNTELRAKYESDPSKFIQSEADLDADIKALSILSEHPELYAEFAHLGCVGSLVGLLAHENSDIAIDALEILNELTDDEVTADEKDWSALVNAAVDDADLLGLLFSNLERLDEKEETDRGGVYHALNVVENLCSSSVTAEKVGAQENLLRWLLRRIQAKEATTSQNKQYSAEIIAILVQSSNKNRRKLVELDAVDTMLQLVASYRKRDPEPGEEEEYMENLFEALTCIVDEPIGKTKFIEAEGTELCLIMLKEGKLSKIAALRLLDHAVGGPTGAEVCLKVVEAGGLKNVFTLFMKKSDNNQTAEHLIGIFASMLRLLPGGSAERIRTLAKFVEKNYEKTVKLVNLRRGYAARLDVADEAIRSEQAKMSVGEREDAADEWFSRRLEAGLFSLQTIDVVLAWLVAEDDGARRKITGLLDERDEDLGVIQRTIQEQLESMDAVNEEAEDTREMLTTLTKFLQ